MTQASVQENISELVDLVELDESKTQPRLRVPLRLPPEPSLVARCASVASRVVQAPARWRLAPAVLLGALLGSAPYLIEQHVRARVAETPQPPASSLTSQPTVALPAPTLPAPLPPPSGADDAAEVPPRARAPRAALERALLAHARRQLRNGDGIAAQLALERLAQRVPRGRFVRQRRLLEIRVLLAIGANAAARRAASAYAKAYPRSRDLGKLSALLLDS